MMRRPAFLGAIAMTVLVALYSVYVGQQAMAFLDSGEAIGVAIGVALIVMPVIALWWLAMEWRLGVAVQRMTTRLDSQGRLPVDDFERTDAGAIAPESAQAAFEVARRVVDDNPDDWASWFHVAAAYEANGDRRMARRALGHAAALFRAEQRGRVSTEG